MILEDCQGEWMISEIDMITSSLFFPVQQNMPEWG
jgi:hypothetical protein